MNNSWINAYTSLIKIYLKLENNPKKHATIPRDRRILMRKRKKLNKKIYKSNKVKQKLIDIELLLQNSYDCEREKNEQDASSKIKSNPKYFYSYVKRFSKTKPKVGPLKDPLTNKLTTDCQEMANILQNQYCSAFASPKSDYSFLTQLNLKKTLF